MTRVVLDDTVWDKLAQAETVELCDPTGRRVGHFLSDELYRRLLYDWANAQISDEELDRRYREPGGRTLAEIWARLSRS
ncbi:MAG: hypothetical protein GXY83_19515 [Rhodopirellula sp.]|nr:hypothetical protein [Rhodopirellula sp.]